MYLCRDYLVTTKIGDKVVKVVWDPISPLSVGSPAHWLLVKTKRGIGLRAKYWPKERKSIPIASFRIEKGGIFAIPKLEDTSKKSGVFIQIQPILFKPAIRSHENIENKKLDLYLFYGVNDYYFNYSQVGSDMHFSVKRQNVFRLYRKGPRYRIQTFNSSLEWEDGTGKVWIVPSNSSRNINVDHAPDGVLRFGEHWWRFRFFPIANSGDVLKIAQEVPEDIRKLRATGAFVTSGVILAGLLSLALPTPHKKELPVAQSVQLKAPKKLTSVEDKPKLPPEMKKVAKLITPPKKVEAKAVVPKPTAPPPKPMPKAAPVKPMPAPAPVAKAPAPTPAPSAKSKLASSLQFLSPGKGRPLPKVATNIPVGPQTQGVPFLKNEKNGIRALNAETPSDSKPLRTYSPEMIGGSDSKFTRSSDAAQVRGRVAKNELGNPGGSLQLEGSSGLEMQGEGRLTEAEIMKALEEILPRLQYCYEKSLWSNSKLLGSVQMGWVVETSGVVSSAKVIRSQLANNGLHDCLIKELKAKRFPKPRGGNAEITYTFNFSQSGV